MCWDAKYRNTTLQAQKLIVSYQVIKSGDLEIEWRYGAEFLPERDGKASNSGAKYSKRHIRKWDVITLI